MASAPVPSPQPAVDPTQTIASSYTWGGVFDFARRQYAASAAYSATDQLFIIRKVSAFAYRYVPYPFTLVQTTPNSIPCVQGVQDYPQPPNLYRLTRAWFYVPTVTPIGANFGTVPPYDDPSVAADFYATASAQYVGALNPSGGPAALIYPPSGSLIIEKRLAPSLIPRAYTQIQAITQQPNQGLIRLDSATAVSPSQPYSLELEFQPIRPPVSALTEPLWFPDDYLAVGMEGIVYELYRSTNDPRAGQQTFAADGSIQYSGQLAVWMGALQSAAAAEREGAVDQLVPDAGLGAGGGSWGGTWGGWGGQW